MAAVPITALAIIQLLQNVDLITAKHQFNDRVASSYAVAAVAGKVLIWVAMGASFYLVPETSRLRAQGLDARPVLLKSIGIVAVCAVPCMLIFAFGAHPLLAAVFGKSKAIASGSLLPLGAAFTVLAATYLAVQYMLALKRVWFLPAIGLIAAIEPVLLLQAPKHPASFATVVLFVQLLGAAVVYAIALSRRPALRAGRLEEPELLAIGRRRLRGRGCRLVWRGPRLLGRGRRRVLGRRCLEPGVLGRRRLERRLRLVGRAHRENLRDPQEIPAQHLEC